MRFVRFQRVDGSPWGRLADDEVIEVLTDAPYQPGARATGERVPLPAVQLLAPVVPSKVVAVGLNYPGHVAEVRKLLPKHDLQETPTEMVFSLRPPSSLIGPGASIVRPKTVQRVDYEAELAVVVGRKARRVPPQEAHTYVFGYSCYNDCTDRETQMRGPMYSQKAKSHDTFAPCGPWIEIELDISTAVLRCRVNGEVRQEAQLSTMIFSVPEIISHISQYMTLFPGDLVVTGSPSGIAPLRDGDVVEVSVDGLGTLRNVLILEKEG